jgi:hypothetical protein
MSGPLNWRDDPICRLSRECRSTGDVEFVAHVDAPFAIHAVPMFLTVMRAESVTGSKPSYLPTAARTSLALLTCLNPSLGD